MNMYLKIYLTLLVISTTTVHVNKASWTSFLSREKCIADLGCFDAGPPFLSFNRLISLLPEDREVINTQFFLYTPGNLDPPQNFSNIRANVGNIVTSSFNPKASTTFVVPGYMSETAPGWKMTLVEALINYRGDNVFLVDWDGGDGPIYQVAVANTRVVGAEIAFFVQQLQSIVGLKPEKVHIIGHSLGSHIAGYAGKNLKKLGRITGLDPAGPDFTDVDPVVRLDRNDALFVDVIHTDAALSLNEGLGLIESIGHFDFYPNGGNNQPGCKEVPLSEKINTVWLFLTNPTLNSQELQDVQCNHLRAIYLFISSIYNGTCKLWAVTCSDWYEYVSGKCGSCKEGQNGACTPLGIQAGQYASKIKQDQSINVFLNTTESEPFC